MCRSSDLAGLKTAAVSNSCSVEMKSNESDSKMFRTILSSIQSICLNLSNHLPYFETCSWFVYFKMGSLLNCIGLFQDF